MISSPYRAADWPIAAAMLPFGNKDSRGGAIHDAEPEEWAEHLRLVRRIGFTEVDPTDTWVRVGDLSPERLAEFKSVLSDVGLTIPAISTSRRSVMDPVLRIVARPLDTLDHFVMVRIHARQPTQGPPVPDCQSETDKPPSTDNTCPLT